MRHVKDNIFIIIENCIDMLLSLFAYFFAYLFTLIVFGRAFIDIRSPYTMLFVFLGILFYSLVSQFFGINKPLTYTELTHRIFSIIISHAVCFLFALLAALIFAEREVQPFIIVWLVISAFISALLLIAKKKLIIYLLHLSGKCSDIIRKLIIVGNNPDVASEFIKEIIRVGADEMILGSVGEKLGASIGCEYLGDLCELKEILDKYKPDYAVFAIDSYDKDSIIKFVNLCDDRCVKIYFLPVIYGYLKSARQIEHLGALPLINVHATPLDSKINAAVKRLVDVLGSLVLIIFFLPLMIITAIGVKLSSPGPILFRQVRVGRMGRKFRMLKFRSMRVSPESESTWSTGTDGRKTKFGHFIRKTSIDELPQLFNVLMGTMSLVGPRPEIPHFVERFKDKIPLYMVKHYVKPGITGLAQIKGLRGDTSVEERIIADISYIENWSLSMDIGILLRTPFNLINKKEKYKSSDARGDRGEE